MPSKLRKALGAVKDQTSISLAKVSSTNASNLEVLILKATRHDEVPIDERYVKELLGLISSNKIFAAGCAQAIGKRIGKTRNWIVALKSLMLVLKIFQDGDPYFPREVLHTMKRGAKILNLSTFRDDSNSSPWDYTAFVRTFSLYLDERLDCFITGKLQRRYTNNERDCSHPRSQRASNSINDMKPAMLLDRISYWQKLLDRAVATRPTGAAKTNKLVQVSLYAIVRESFDLYRDIYDGLRLLLDSFFHLPYQSCVTAFQTCVKASKQFEELCSFYDLCKSIGVGRTSEYPSVQKISEELIETLKEFLKDQSSFPTNGKSPPRLFLPAAQARERSSSSERFKSADYSETAESIPEKGSEIGLYCTSLEDLISTIEMGTSPCISMDNYLEQFERRSHTEDITSGADTVSIQSMPLDQSTISAANSYLDLVSLDDWPPEEYKQEQDQGQRTSTLESSTGLSDSWEMVLAETASQPTEVSSYAGERIEASTVDDLFHQESTSFANAIDPPVANNLLDQDTMEEHQYNPFLQDTIEIPTTAANVDNQVALPLNEIFAVAPTFQATPTFSSLNPSEAMAQNVDDPFGPSLSATAKGHESNRSLDQESLLQEQQLWLQHQNKIIAKNMS